MPSRTSTDRIVVENVALTGLLPKISSANVTLIDLAPKEDVTFGINVAEEEALSEEYEIYLVLSDGTRNDLALTLDHMFDASEHLPKNRFLVPLEAALNENTRCFSLAQVLSAGKLTISLIQPEIQMDTAEVLFEFDFEGYATEVKLSYKQVKRFVAVKM